MKIRLYIILAFLVPAYILYLVIGFIADVRGYTAAAASRADAIVVLTGGKGRTHEGLRLLRRGAGRMLVVSGVHTDADLGSIFHGEGVTAEEQERIILEKSSRSTYENAVEAAGIIEGLGAESIILITSGYHMKRALKTFRRTLPRHVIIDPYPVRSPNFDMDRWWRGTSLSIAFAEFVKYYWYEARFILGV